MFRQNVRLHKPICLLLMVCILSLTTAQQAFCEDSKIIISQDNNLTFVEKQPLSDNELLVLNESGQIDYVTAGHRPVPVHHGRSTSDIFFWAGFSLIMLSVLIYPY